MLKRRRIIGVFAVLLLPVLGLLAGWRGSYYFICWFIDPEYSYELSVIPHYSIGMFAATVIGFLVGMVSGVASLLWAASSARQNRPLPNSKPAH
jgi:hypothetical protein